MPLILEKARRGFLRQNLQLFDLNISENDWKFALPELDNDKKTTKIKFRVRTGFARK